MKLIDADKLYNTFDEYGDFTEFFVRQILNIIENQEEVEAIPISWIPCSERLPEEKDAGILKKLGTDKKSELVLATVEVKGERMTVTACTHDGKWEWNMKYAFPNFKVVAWMPLPKPYVEEVVKQGETE